MKRECNVAIITMRQQRKYVTYGCFENLSKLSYLPMS